MFASHKFYCCIAIIMAPGLLAGCANEPPLDGARLFAANCVACHGEQADGNGPAAAGIDKEVPDLRQIANRNGGRFPRSLVRNSIDRRTVLEAHQSEFMPTWGETFAGGDLSEADAKRRVNDHIDALVDYLAEIQIRN